MNIYPPGTRIDGRYLVTGHPLLGGMGLVYLCHDLEDDRPVALKTFRPEYLPDRAARERFLQEGTHWVKLGTHSHIVRCYDVLYADPEVYLVLELVARAQGREDASLRAWLTPGVLFPAEQALLFALQIVRGMQHAVETIPGFVHRDLKPENVLVGADRLAGDRPSDDVAANRVRVTDFGLVRALDVRTAVVVGEDEPLLDRPSLTRVGAVLGTPPYMAPEQWERPDVDLRADVYALGCILGEMLTGRMLVEENTLYGFRQAHRAGRAAQATANLPGSLTRVLARCLAVEPGARYGNWTEAEAGLAAAYQAVADRPAPPPTSEVALSRDERLASGWAYNAMAGAYLDLGRTEVALRYFGLAKAVGEAEAERMLVAATLGNMGLAYTRLGDAQRAIGYHEQSLAIDREISNQQGEGASLGNLGSAYLQLGDTRQAIRHYEQTLVINREIGSRQGEGHTLGNLGSAYRQSGDARQAIDYHKQCLVITREIGDRRGEASTLSNLGEAYRLLSDVRQAIGHYEQALAIFREIGDRRGEGTALGNLGVACADLGDAGRAIDYHERAIAISREIGDRHGEGTDLSNMGDAYLQLGNVKQAIDYFEKGLEISREIGDRRGEGNALGNLGSAYADLGDARRSIGYYEQALGIFRKIGERQRESTSLGNLGGMYIQLGEPKRAIGYIEQQLDITSEIGDRRGEGNALGNLGTAYKNLGDVQQAIEYQERALTIYQEIGDTPTAAMLSANLAMSLAQIGEVGEAVPLLEQAIQDLRQNGYTQQARQAEQMLAQIRGAEVQSNGPSEAEILANFAPIVEAVAAGAIGNRNARAAVEAAFGRLEQGGWRIVEPTQRIWAGERDEMSLTRDIDANSALIIREILKHLKSGGD